MRKPIRLITAGEIKKYYSMKQAIDSMERAFSLMSSGESFVPLRFVTKLPSNEMMMLFKPAYVEKEKRISVKFLTQRGNSKITDIPNIQGIVLLMDADTGEILSLMDGEYITAMRTGAASGLATRLFARKDANILALFGCGAQGRTQIEAVACERDIKKVLVFDKNKNTAERFIQEMQEKYSIEMVCTSDTSHLNDADIICTATNSTEPLFKKEVLKKGVHINAIGSFQPNMQELDPYILRDAKVYVDQITSCLSESGDFIKPIEEGIILKSHIVGEIGDFCLNKIKGRESENEITVFKSVGIAIQDFTVATDIYNSSLKNSFGHDINLFE
jgi:ornithine cyclodeaminase/alanine dehydrogenase-like protein (mu-crystallin family)